MLKIKVNTYTDIGIFLKEEKEKFFDAITHGIKSAIDDNTTMVRVAEFAILDEDNIISIDIEEEDWNESLHLALYHYEGIEEYEKCGELQKLIDDIHNDR